MLEYARWKYILVAVVLVVALLFALPNLFGDDCALQIARKDRDADRRADSSRSIEKRSRTPAPPSTASSSTTATSWCASPTTSRSCKGARHRQGRKDRPDQGLRQRDDVCLARAALDAGAGPARHAAGSRPARRPLSAVPGGRRRRGRAAAQHLRAGFPPRARAEKIPFTDINSLTGRFGHSQWPARAAARGRRSRRGARRTQEGAARSRLPRRRASPMAPRSIA